MTEKLQSENIITINTDIDQPSSKQKKENIVFEFDEYGIPTLSKQRLYLAVTALCAAIFLAGLDGTIVASALPTITNKFNAANSARWLIAANLLVNTCFRPLFGKISDIFGRKETLILSILVFETGSVISGIVNSVNMLIFSRALTGVGAAGLIVMAQIVISEMVPIAERGRYTGSTGLAFGTSNAVGPLLGGLFTDHFSYRWCFFINLPVSLLAGLIIILLVKTKKPQGGLITKVKRFDTIGGLLLVGGLAMLILGLNFGGNEHPWVSTTVFCLLAYGAILICLYSYYDLKIAKEPILPLDLFSQRNIWSVLAAQFFMGFGLYGIMYTAPAYDTTVHNASAIGSGLFLLPLVLTMVVFSVIGGIAITKTGMYIFMFRIGTIIIAIGIGMMVSINENTKGVLTGLYLALCGVGCGLCMQSFLLSIQASVPKTVIAGATSSIAFARMLGGAIGNTLSVVMQKSVLTSKIQQLIEQYPDTAKLIANTVRNTSLIHEPTVDPILKAKLIHVHVTTIRTSFIMFTAVLCLSFFITLLARHIVLGGE